MKSPSARSPVFVDSTGRRQRRIRRTGVWLAVPAVGYLVLLTSSLLGGPRVDTPLIPLPPAAVHQPGPKVSPGPVRAVNTPGPEETRRSTGPTTTSSDRPTTQPVTTQPTTTPAPTLTPTSSATPTPGPPTKTPGHGKPTAPPGRTKSPSKP